MSAPYGNALRKADRVKRNAAIVRLKQDGLSFEAIGKELGIGRASAHRGFYEAVNRIGEPEVAAYRAEHVARLSMAREIVMDILSARHVTISQGHVISEITGHDDDGKPVYGEPYEDDGVTLNAVASLLKIDEREAKLLGLDSKAEISVTGSLKYEITGMPADDSGN